MQSLWPPPSGHNVLAGARLILSLGVTQDTQYTKSTNELSHCFHLFCDLLLIYFLDHLYFSASQLHIVISQHDMKGEFLLVFSEFPSC